MRTLALVLVVVLVPVFLVLTNVRLVMSYNLVRYEYGKADFPPAPTLDPLDRMPLALAGIDLITGRMTIQEYGALKLRDGTPAFLEREVSHMADVQKVTQSALTIQLIAGALLIM